MCVELIAGCAQTQMSDLKSAQQLYAPLLQQLPAELRAVSSASLEFL